MTDLEDQTDELMALSEILDGTDFVATQSEAGHNTGVMTVTVSLMDEAGLQVTLSCVDSPGLTRYFRSGRRLNVSKCPTSPPSA